MTTKSADPDELQQSAVSHLGLQDLLVSLLWEARHKCFNGDILCISKDFLKIH